MPYRLAIPQQNFRKIDGDPYGIRTRVTAVKGRCLNRLTKGPFRNFNSCQVDGLSCWLLVISLPTFSIIDSHLRSVNTFPQFFYKNFRNPVRPRLKRSDFFLFISFFYTSAISPEHFPHLYFCISTRLLRLYSSPHDLHL